MEEKIKILKDLIPVITATFLICNFIFNLGYFFHFDIKFMGLLTLSDYFEGTVYVAILTLIVSIIILLYMQDFKSTINDVKNIEKKVENIENTVKNNNLKILYKTFQDFLYIKNECKEIYLQNIFLSFTIMFILFLVLYFLFKNIVWLFFPLIFLIPQFLIFKSKYYMSNLLIICFCVLINFCGGMNSFRNDYTQNKEIVKIKDNNYFLIRPISKGAIVKSSDNKIVFINNTDISDITVNLKRFKPNK